MGAQQAVWKGVQASLKRRVFAHDSWHDCVQQIRLMLRAGDCEWCPHLPARLKKLHSHWLCRAENVVLLRGQAYDDRGICYIMRLCPSEMAPGYDADVFEVPARFHKASADMLVRTRCLSTCSPVHHKHCVSLSRLQPADRCTRANDAPDPWCCVFRCAI